MPALARLQVPTPCDRFDIEARLRTGGPDALDDAEALQLLAGLGEGRSEALIAEFGSLPEALAADVAALRRVVPTDQAARLKLAADVARRLLVAPLQARSVLSSWTAVCDYLRAGLAGRTREEFRVLFLDKRNRLIRDEVMGRGTVDHAPVYPREVVRRALELDACALVLVHNHPGGDPTPSTADIDMTRQVVAAAQALRIAVHDHVVVGGQSVASFRALGLL
jgi:DNA repair protein RadC